MWTPDGRLVISVERDDTTRLAVVESRRRVASAPGHRARRPRRVRRRGRAGRLARRDRGGLHLPPARRSQAQRDPRGGARRRRRARAHRHPGDAGPCRGVVARREHDRLLRPSEPASTSFTPWARHGSDDRQVTSSGADHSEHEWHSGRRAAGRGPRPEQPLRPRGRRRRATDPRRPWPRAGPGPVRTGPRRARSWPGTRTTSRPRSCVSSRPAPSPARSTHRRRWRYGPRRTRPSRTSPTSRSTASRSPAS